MKYAYRLPMVNGRISTLILALILEAFFAPSLDAGGLESFLVWSNRIPLSASKYDQVREGVQNWQLTIGIEKLYRYGQYRRDLWGNNYNVAVVFDPEIDPDLDAWLQVAEKKFKAENFSSLELKEFSLATHLANYVAETLPQRLYPAPGLPEIKRSRPFPPLLGQMIREKRAHQIAQEAALRILFYKFGIPHMEYDRRVVLILDDKPFSINLFAPLVIRPELELSTKAIAGLHKKWTSAFEPLESFDLRRIFRPASKFHGILDCIGAMIRMNDDGKTVSMKR